MVSETVRMFFTSFQKRRLLMLFLSCRTRFIEHRQQSVISLGRVRDIVHLITPATVAQRTKSQLANMNEKGQT